MAVNTAPATRTKHWRLALLLGPAAFWLGVFFLLPLGIIVLYSLLSRTVTGAVAWTFTLDNFARLFSAPVYLRIFGRSVWMGFLATFTCLLMSYPLALFIIRQNSRWRTILVFLILIPFWTNFLVRTYAWMVILNYNGLINDVITRMGGTRLTLLNTPGAVLLGLVYGHLPFMVLPIYATLDRFDFNLLDAASDLGASRWQAFWRVMLPLTMPGITAGSVLVFILAAGNYIVPELLGGNKTAMIGNFLAQQFGPAQDPPLGAAAALLVMLLLTVGVIFYFRVTTEEER